jgi:ATP-binding cassette subfamily F protein 3
MLLFQGAGCTQSLSAVGKYINGNPYGRFVKPLISVRDLRKSFPGLLLLERVNFDIYPGDKIGMVGANGTGKTTLLKMILGQEIFDYGDVFFKPDIRAGWLTQYQTADSEETVSQALSESDYSTSLKTEISSIEERLKDPDFYKSGEYDEIMRRYSELQSEFARFSGAGVSDRARVVLDRLGSGEIEPTAKIKELSGGERRKVALAKVLVAAGSMDILLLDEPTNHLDIDAIEWLEEFICDFGGTVIVVSHDRYLLDDTVFRIFEIENNRLRTYEGDFTSYVEQKALRTAIMERAKAKYDSEIRRQREIIQKLRGRNRFDAQIRNKLTRMEKMERPEDPEVRKRRLKIKFKRAAEKGGRNVVTAKDLAKSFNGRTLFDEVYFEIEQGYKVGLIGPNGCGKTTLLRMIVGQEDLTGGELRLSKVLRAGYFDQGHLSLESGNNLIEELKRVDSAMIDDEAKSLLGRYGFKSDTVYGKVGKLSGGERARLSILKLVLSPYNILVLDEPTNHLDLDSRQAVERAINSYDGTIIIASHDRYFLDSTCDHMMAMYGGHVRMLPGNYTQYRSIIAREEAEASRVPGPAYYVVRKGYTDWETKTRYRQGERLKLEPEDLRRHRWALETKHLVREEE